MLKYMNLHSSNDLAEAFAAEMGGSQATLETVLSTSGLPPQEVQLQNGSGLGEANKMTPRAVVGIFIAIQRRLAGLNLDLKDAFPVSGQDIGTLEDRTMPKGAVVKTGTLWNVSALAGYIPTEKEGRVWFAIMNEGDDYVDGFRKSQDVVLNQMVQNFALNGGASAPIP
jgi:D-alanyl-D-alanine carboxypeptidase/D-alanyl-D-alanine-endopeptidase (penicillin-binding protein 4)